MTDRWILFEVTRRCNRACAYCYNPDRNEPQSEQLQAPHLEALLDRIFAQGAQAGVTIIGGEPLTLQRLEDVVRAFARRGVRPVISTNGTLLTNKRILSLLEAGVGGFEVSLDSPKPTVHNMLTGRPGLERVRRGLAELASTPVPVTVGAVLTAPMLSSLADLLDLCFVLSVRRVVLAQFAPVGLAQTHAVDLTLTDQQLEFAMTLANNRSGLLGLSVGIGLPVEPCRFDRKRYPNLVFEACRCGVDKWVVEPSGAVRTCELAPCGVGNLFDLTFSDLAYEPDVISFLERHRSACRECGDWDICRGGCRFLSSNVRGPC